MGSNAKRVLAVWASLTSDERQEAVEYINEYQNASEDKRRDLGIESLKESRSVSKSTTMNFGPLGDGCPYCGK